MMVTSAAFRSRIRPCCGICRNTDIAHRNVLADRDGTFDRAGHAEIADRTIVENSAIPIATGT